MSSEEIVLYTIVGDANIQYANVQYATVKVKYVTFNKNSFSAKCGK